ncbi:hypothetical protein BDZ85DRAFT_240023 [Elsinoe ampelina]|uniref:TPR domain protein n=1 Tax=Elsinoe ampelina TaxID=302913 RepID=A0A6A6G7G0_9PEZI|nr:hypothetical protein BDZ85DRAFT_240023 [Elsinoe ampelina]
MLDIYQSVSKYPYNLGSHSRKVTTPNADAQTWFDRGLIWLFGFNLDEAARCFTQAIACDDACPMAHWGLAYALGPHYNFGWLSQGEAARTATVQKTFAAAQRALSVASKTSYITPVEKALVRAIQARYPQQTPPTTLEEFGEWNRGYADAMEGVYREFPDDLDVAALYADAMMTLTPWRLWDVSNGTPTPGARTLQAKVVLEKALGSPGAHDHPGLLHLYIHLMEMSPNPELAIPFANLLRGLTPDSGHLQHMPSHIDVLVGAYDQAATANQIAGTVDDVYLERRGLNSVYTTYVLHNITSLIFAAMMAGNSTAALQGCDRLEHILTETFLSTKEPRMADFAESFLSTRPHVLIRFGRWTDILSLPIPHDPILYCVTTTTIHYAKAIAHAALDHIPPAVHHQRLFLSSLATVPDSRLTYPNNCRKVLAVGQVMLDGELAYRKGEYDLAFRRLHDAVAIEDALGYSEPPAWMVPARHAAAALLLERDRVREAARLYADDLGVVFEGVQPALPRARRHPRNMWALAGYGECLERLGMEGERGEVERELERARRGADVRGEVSCFCRTGKRAEGKEKKGVTAEGVGRTLEKL